MRKDVIKYLVEILEIGVLVAVLMALFIVIYNTYIVYADPEIAGSVIEQNYVDNRPIIVEEDTKETLDENEETEEILETSLTNTKLTYEQKYALAETVLKEEGPTTEIDENTMDTITYLIYDYHPEEIEVSKNPKENIAYAISDVNPYEGYITKWMDLMNRRDITEADMEYLIEHFTKAYPDSLLKNQGWAFIEASKITGYDPIFLLALTAQEAGWDVADLHRSKNNAYSIRMYDEDVNMGYHMGNSYADGIINGAIWLKQYYYNEGAYCIKSMVDKHYASDPNWGSGIVWIMDEAYRLLF